MINWQPVFKSYNAIECEILRAYLSNHDIPAMVFNEMDSSYKAFGEVLLKVPQEFALEATRIINSRQEEQDIE